MKSKLFASVLIASLLTVATIGMVSAYTVLDTAAAIRAEGQIPFTPQTLLDNFNAGTATNAWNCATGTFYKDGTTARCTASYDSSIAYGGTGRSLKLLYNVNALNSYAGYSSQLGGANLISLGTPPVTSTAISFYVKGAVGGEFFKVQLKNKSTALYPYSTTQYYRNTASVYITDYLDGGVTTTWQKVTIPLHNFMNLDGWTSMKEFVVVFENSQSANNGSATSGTVYIDNIVFETVAASTVRIDHFGHKGKDGLGNDKPGANSLGGNIGAGGDGGTINAFADATNFSPYKYGMRLEYNITTGYAYTFLVFGGGQDIDPNANTNRSGWIAVPHNFSGYNNLFFKIRGASAGNPKIMKIEIVDNSHTSILLINNIATTWQDYRIDLSDTAAFPNLDRTSIKQLTFTLEGWRIGDASGNKSGTVFIDSIQFE